MRATLGSLWGHFGVTLGIETSNGTCNASVRCICVGLVGPKIENVLPTAARSKFLKGQSGHEDPTEELQVSEPDHFWVTLGAFWCHLGITSGI